MQWIIGASTVTLLDVGAFTDDAALFFPDGENGPGFTRPETITLALNCLLIEAGDKRILVDTGFGTKPGTCDDVAFVPDAQGLLAGLRPHAQPEEIDIVVNTHLHSDHSGGNTSLVGDSVQPTFPRARYWLQRGEWAEAHRISGWQRTLYRADAVVPLEEAGQVHWLSGAAQLTAEARCVVAPGHTTWHQYIEVDDGHASLLFLGDVAPTRFHLERPSLHSLVDLDPATSTNTRRAICQKAIARNSVVLLTHEPAPGRIVTVDRTEQEFRFVPLTERVAPA
jgi:glyoxylase-like metal-dependent hydrolase (beta-lactamase superfamily II)